MGELMLQKAVACRDRLAKIRLSLPDNPQHVRGNEQLEAYLSFNIFLLLQDAIALATQLVSAHGLGIPSSQREAFEALAKANLITASTATAMSAAASLRNRIAHTYGDLDPVRLVAEAPAGLDVVERFLNEVSPSL